MRGAPPASAQGIHSVDNSTPRAANTKGFSQATAPGKPCSVTDTADAQREKHDTKNPRKQSRQSGATRHARQKPGADPGKADGTAIDQHEREQTNPYAGHRADAGRANSLTPGNRPAPPCAHSRQCCFHTPSSLSSNRYSIKVARMKSGGAGSGKRKPFQDPTETSRFRIPRCRATDSPAPRGTRRDAPTDHAAGPPADARACR